MTLSVSWAQLHIPDVEANRQSGVRISVNMSTCTVTPVVGYPQLHEWAGIAHNQSNSLNFVFSLKGEGASNLGKDLIDQIKLYEPQGSADLHQGLLDLLSQVRHTNCSIQFAASLIGNERVVFASLGGSISLKKPTRIIDVIGGNDQLQLVEGRRGDYIAVLATDAGTEFLVEIKQRLEQNYEPTTIASALVRAIQDETDTSQVAIAFIECKPLNSLQTESLLAHASTVMVRGETIAPPSVSVEDINCVDQVTVDGQTAGHSASRIPGSLPNRPNQSQRIARELKAVTKKIVQITGSKLAITFTLLSKLSKKGFVATVSVLKQLPSLPKKYQLTDKAVKLKIWIVLGGTFGLLLGAGIFSLIKKQEFANLEKKYRFAIVAPKNLRSEATALNSTDPIQARAKANQSVTDLEALKEQFGTNRTLAAELQKEISEAQAFATDISGKQELTQLQVFFDLRLTDSAFVADSIELLGEKLYFLDKEKKQLVTLDILNKQSDLASIPLASTPTDWTTSSKTLYFLDKGLSGYDFESKKIITLKETGDTDRDGTHIRVFSSFIYVLNPVKRNIFRFTINKSELSQGIGWITDKKNLDFAQIHDFTIDGSIWLTTKTGEIKKYTQGQPQSFQVSGLETAFNSPLIIFTSENSEAVFVLEPNQNRLVSMSKDGKLLKEVKSPELGAATDLTVNSQTNTAYVLSGSTVYTIPTNR